MTGICDVLLQTAPQLRHIGSYNPTKLDPAWKPWLMRAERVFIDTFAGDFKRFFGAIATEYKNASEAGLDPETRIMDWIREEIRTLKRAEKKLREAAQALLH